MLKKLFVLFILILGLSVYSADNTSTTLSKLEDVTFGVDYSNEKPESRLSRLEKNIYGQSKTGSIKTRLDKINKDIAGDVIGEEITPTKDTFMNEEDIIASDGTENYPILNEIEQKLFNKSSPEKSLHSRIVNIEKKLFNKSYDTEDYYTRVERIKAEYYNQNPPIANNWDNDNYGDSYGRDYTAYNDTEPDIQSYYTPPTMRNWNSKNQGPYSTYSPKDEYELAALEERILNNTYPNDTVNDRLSRLENKVFETDFFYDDAKIRIDRLASVSKAKKSSHKYDNNRFYSKLNTAVSIGSMLLMVLAFIL